MAASSSQGSGAVMLANLVQPSQAPPRHRQDAHHSVTSVAPPLARAVAAPASAMTATASAHGSRGTASSRPAAAARASTAAAAGPKSTASRRAALPGLLVGDIPEAFASARVLDAL